MMSYLLDNETGDDDMILYQQDAAGNSEVFYDGVRIGVVRKREDWTVRGTRIRWEAWRKGKCITSDAFTRNEAVEALRVGNT